MSEIRVNERYAIEADPRCWQLHEYYQGKGKAKLQRRTQYYATLNQVSREILNRTAGDCESLEEIIRLFNAADKIVTGDLEALAGQEAKQ